MKLLGWTVLVAYLASCVTLLFWSFVYLPRQVAAWRDVGMELTPVMETGLMIADVTTKFWFFVLPVLGLGAWGLWSAFRLGEPSRKSE